MRSYIPEVGARVKLKSISAYNENYLPLWAWLKVLTEPVTGVDGWQLKVDVLNGSSPTGETRLVKLKEIEPPLGWKPVYTITCKDMDQALKVQREWFARGIHVWASHDLSSAGRMAYTPVVNEGDEFYNPRSPHWRYTGNPVETICPPDCEKFFRIEVLHQWEPELPPTSNRTARRKAIAALRQQAGVELFFVADGMGGRMPICTQLEVVYPRGTK